MTAPTLIPDGPEAPNAERPPTGVFGRWLGEIAHSSQNSLLRSRRDQFTAAALEGLLGSLNGDSYNIKDLAMDAVTIADAVLVRLEQVPHPLLDKEEEAG